jgi:hypothetical protein
LKKKNRGDTENKWYNEEYTDEITKINEHHGLDIITIEEVKEALENSKNRKTTGLDELNMEVFKHGGTISQLRLMHLSNMCWKTCAILKDWLKAEVISLFKKGNRNIRGNYRGISLPDSAYKTYVRILNQRLKGFRRGR